MRKFLFTLTMGLFLSLLVSRTATANDEQHRCDLGLLDGLYVFTASGFAIPTTGPSFPKAIIEVLRFHGDGTVETPAAMVNMNGNPGNPATRTPGGGGTYTVSPLSPPEAVCIGTLTFTDPPRPSFEIVSGGGKRIGLIMTNPPSVFEGNAIKVSR